MTTSGQLGTLSNAGIRMGPPFQNKIELNIEGFHSTIIVAVIEV